jgi:anti-sigma regulatory factor (Ser/Thr protein kinase)
VLAGVVLMTSELVTNAVRHASAGRPSTVGLRVAVFPKYVRVEVDDPGQGFDPSEHTFEGGRISGPGHGGRGLFVVDRTATRWGSGRGQTDRGRRFSVWFEIGTT